MALGTVSYQRAGRLVPKRRRGLRARSVALRPGKSVAWHSTKEREELLIALSGHVDVEARADRGTRRTRLKAGRCLWLARRTLHRVVNRSSETARYLYVTGAA